MREEKENIVVRIIIFIFVVLVNPSTILNSDFF